jgi:hypothetical protein
LIPEPQPIQRTAWCGVGVGESVQRSNQFTKILNDGKLWTFGIASLFALSKTAAQETLPGNINILEIKAVRDPVKNPTDMLTDETDTKTTDSLQVKTDSGTIKLPTDSMSMESLALLSADEFINAVQSSGARTNIDSLLQLPRSKLARHLELAEKNPTRIEFDTVKINPVKPNHDFNYTSILINSFFVERLNVIRMHYFIPDESVQNNDSITLDLIRALNAEIPYALLHEKTHAAEAATF